MSDPRTVAARPWLGAALIVVLALALAACGGRDDGDSAGASQGGAASAAQGVSDTEIKVGGSFPFSGALAGFGEASKGLNAYFEKINADGGVNGRKIVYDALDDGYDPARGVTNARRLIQQEKVFALAVFGAPALTVGPVAATSNTPHMALAGISALSDKEQFPTTRAWFPNNDAEAEAVARRILASRPNAKVGLVLLNNDAGLTYGKAAQTVLEQGGAKVVKQTVYEPTDTTATSQINQIRAAGADTVVFLASGSPLIEGLKHIEQLNWDPLISVNESQSGILPIMSKAGDAGNGAWSMQFMKDPADPQWDDDEAMAEYKADIEEFGGGADPEDGVVLKGYALGKAFVQIIESLGDDITAKAFLKAWDTLPQTDIGLMYPGMTLEGGPDGRLIHQFQPATFRGDTWEADGEPVTVEQE
jgi:branched-chain amino acid transport system substrate-binding protein